MPAAYALELQHINALACKHYTPPLLSSVPPCTQWPVKSQQMLGICVFLQLLSCRRWPGIIVNSNMSNKLGAPVPPMHVLLQQ